MLTATTIQNYSSVYFQADKDQSYLLNIVQIDQYGYEYKIGRFNFYTKEGFLLMLNGKRKEYKQFQSLLNTFFKYDESFGWDYKVVENCKTAGTQLIKAEKKASDKEYKDMMTNKAMDFLNKVTSNDETTINNLQSFKDKTDSELLEVINNTFKGQLNKQLTNDILNAIKAVFVVVEEVTTTQEKTTELNENNQTTNYIVGNRTFTTYSEAETYCNSVDFDPELMIQESASTGSLNSNINDNTIGDIEVFHLYKNTFNSHLEAYNYALNNRIPVTMIISSLHKTMNNERLQELEREYVFSKSNMSIQDIKEYFDYISSLRESLDQQERYYKLKSYIDRYNYKQQSKQAAENKRQQLSLEGSRLLVFMKQKGLQMKSTKDYQWYYYKGEHVYSFYSCSVEKYYNDMKELFNKYFSEYTEEYNNSNVYYYKGNENTSLSMDDYPKGWISFNHNSYIATFNRQLTTKEQSYYNLIPYISTDELKAI